MGRSRLERWASREWSRRPAVVLAVSATALSYVRSLHRRGVPTLLLTEQGWIGSPSRYELTIELPAVAEEPGAWLEVLVSTAKRLSRRPVLLVAFDQAVLLVGRHADELGLLYDFLIPPFSTSSALVDKRRQYELADAAGIPIPRTVFPGSSDDAVAFADELGYPCLLKPHVGSAGSAQLGGKVAVVDDPASLRALVDGLAAARVPCLLQEIIPGGDDALYGYLGFWGTDRTELAWITKQKLRQNPTLYGDGTYQRTVEAPRVAELSRQFLAALDYVGVASVEFKYDARDGSFRLIELNPRAVSGNELAVAAGVDLPYISYAYHVDGVVPAWEQQWGIRWIHELYDLKTLLHESRNPRAALREWGRSVRRADAFALGAWDDPVPACSAFVQTGFGMCVRAMGLRHPRGKRGPEGPGSQEAPERRVAD